MISTTKITIPLSLQYYEGLGDPGYNYTKIISINYTICQNN